MKMIILGLTSTYFALFALYNHSAIAQFPWGNFPLSYQQQETSVIDLDYSHSKQPHNLIVSSQADTQLNGEITLNGKVIKVIRGNRVAINLSNCLSKGRNIIEVQGNYKPVSSSVQVEFSAPGTAVSQSTSGSGTIGQTLIIEMR